MNGTDPSGGQPCFRWLTVLAVIGHEISGRVAEPRCLYLDRRENTIGRRHLIARIQTRTHGGSTLAGMAVQVLGHRPHCPADVNARGILDRAPAQISSVFIAELDQSDATQLGSYGLRMVVLAMRERSLDRLQHGLLAIALGAAVDVPDDRDLMVGLALPHVAANQLGAQPIQVFETTAARFDEGWLPELLRVFGARVDVTLAAFGWRQIVTDNGLEVISG